jgi:hypothetical protein
MSHSVTSKYILQDLMSEDSSEVAVSCNALCSSRKITPFGSLSADFCMEPMELHKILGTSWHCGYSVVLHQYSISTSSWVFGIFSAIRSFPCSAGQLSGLVQGKKLDMFTSLHLASGNCRQSYSVSELCRYCHSGVYLSHNIESY